MAEETKEHTLTDAEQSAADEKRRKEFKAEIMQSLIMVRKVIEKYDEEIALLKRRRAEREEEKRVWLDKIVRHEEDRRKRRMAENERLKAAAEKKKKEREERRRALQNPNAFKHIAQDERVRFARMTTAELAREKEETLAKRVPTIDPEAYASDEKMKDIAKELHAKIVKAFGALFDLQEKEKRQKYDINELTTRIAALQAQKVKSAAIVSDSPLKKMFQEAKTKEAQEA